MRSTLRLTVIAAAMALAACGAATEADRSRATASPTETPGEASAEIPSLNAERIQPVGEITMTDEGYRIVGDLVVDSGALVQEYKDADLTLTFDEDGELTHISGEAELPVNLTDTVSIEPGVRAVIGMLSGQEINADPDFGIILKDERNYLVFYIGASTQLTVSDGDEGADEVITLELPSAGQILLIADPMDPFLYRFAGTPLLGEYGEGSSREGLIPFVPQLEHEALDTFDGHSIKKGAMSLGVKVFDFFALSGHRVVAEPQLLDIDWSDPFASDIEYRAGINGQADFSFGVLGIGIFSFELAQTSATLDVGFDRQHLAMALSIAPETDWVPGWFPVRPQTEATGVAYVDGNGSFSFGLGAEWASTLPEADVEGQMIIANDAVTLVGSTVQAGENLQVSISFGDEETIGRVEFPESYAEGITGIVGDALDRELDAVEQQIQELEDAVADYELELSLRGLREALPVMIDEGVRRLDALPGTVYNQARSRALHVMRTTCKKINMPWPLKDVRKCIDDFVNEGSIATRVANEAKRQVQAGIAPARKAMLDLKAAALRANDDGIREALERALTTVYENRTVRKRVKVRHNFGKPFGTRTVYDKTHTITVLNDEQAERILQARDNVHRIDETGGIVIQAQQVLDQLPTREILDEVREGVNEGLEQVPTVDGLGYRTFNDTYEAFVTVDGVDHPVAINVLRPSEVERGVGDLLAQLLLGR